MTEWPLKRIQVGRRFRKALGDLRALAGSIEAVGLLHPVVVTPQGRLIAGRRRLEAVKLLGWRTIQVHVVDLENVIEGELAENVHRKACQRGRTSSTHFSTNRVNKRNDPGSLGAT